MTNLYMLDPTKLFTETVRSIKPFYQYDPLVIAGIYQKYPPQSKTLGEYMSKLWELDCISYNIMEQFI